MEEGLGGALDMNFRRCWQDFRWEFVWAFLGHCNCRCQGEVAEAFACLCQVPLHMPALFQELLTFLYVSAHLTLTTAVEGRQRASPFCRLRNRGLGGKYPSGGPGTAVGCRVIVQV